MVKLTKLNRKTTRELYKKIYLARIEGNDYYNLTVMFKCSRTTVERAIKWAKKFLFEFPKDAELVKNMLSDILNRKSTLRNEMKKLEPTDKVKYNREIRELDNQILVLLGLVKDRKGMEDMSGISDMELLRFIEGEKKIFEGSNENG